MNFFSSKKLLDHWLTQQGMESEDIFKLPAYLALETARAIFSLEIPYKDILTNPEDV